jgi:hypothetical protein
MGKVFGILVIVVAVWVGLTVFSEGTDSAFGGLFAGSEKEIAEGRGQPLTRQVEQQVRDVYREQEERVESRTAE